MSQSETTQGVSYIRQMWVHTLDIFHNSSACAKAFSFSLDKGPSNLNLSIR